MTGLSKEMKRYWDSIIEWFEDNYIIILTVGSLRRVFYTDKKYDGDEIVVESIWNEECPLTWYSKLLSFTWQPLTKREHT